MAKRPTVIIILICLLSGCQALRHLPLPGPAAPIDTTWTKTDCPAAPLAAVTDTNVENSFTCLTTRATVTAARDLGVQPLRAALLLADGETTVQGIWPGQIDGLAAGMSLEIEGAVVSIGTEWSLWVYRWRVIDADNIKPPTRGDRT